MMWPNHCKFTQWIIISLKTEYVRSNQKVLIDLIVNIRFVQNNNIGYIYVYIYIYQSNFEINWASPEY